MPIYIKISLKQYCFFIQPAKMLIFQHISQSFFELPAEISPDDRYLHRAAQMRPPGRGLPGGTFLSRFVCTPLKQTLYHHNIYVNILLYCIFFGVVYHLPLIRCGIFSQAFFLSGFVTLTFLENMCDLYSKVILLPISSATSQRHNCF